MSLLLLLFHSLLVCENCLKVETPITPTGQMAVKIPIDRVNYRLKQWLIDLPNAGMVQ